LSGPLRVLPLGGLGEIGKNMTVVEYDGAIVVVDIGVRFPTAEQPGVDLVLPDFSYLRDRVQDIEGIVVTHGHEDHLGALPWILREIGGDDPPPVFGRPLPMAMARSRLDEHKLRDVELEGIEPGEVLELGPFEIELVHMTHSIPHAAAVAIATDRGTILFTGDYKFDQTPVEGPGPDLARLAQFGRDGLLLLCGDSTNVDRPGWAPSEAGVGPELRRAIARAPGRVVITSFASNLHRVQQVITAADALGRKVCLVGRSMRKYVNVARSLGIMEVPEGLLVAPRELDQLPDERIVIMSTGSQGEPGSALRRMAHNDHPAVKLRPGDLVVFSATPIPGNERPINETIDRLFRIGCDVLTAKDAPIHASGHGYAEEVKLMLALTKPRYVLPVHGDFKRLRLHGELAVQMGVNPADVFTGENGLPLQIDDKGARFGPREQSGVVFVDGLDIGEPDDAAVRDRRTLSADGVIVVVATVSGQTGEPISEAEVVLRGVPVGDDPGRTIAELQMATDEAVRRHAKDNGGDIDLLEKILHDDLAKFIRDRLRRRPLVVPVVVAV